MMRALLVLYLLLTCPEPLCVEFSNPRVNEEAGHALLDEQGARPTPGQEADDGAHPFHPRRPPLDDAPGECAREGPRRPDGHESVDEELRFNGVDLEDQGRSRPSSPQGYHWPLSLAAETADPATLMAILKNSSAGGSSSTSRDVASS